MAKELATEQFLSQLEEQRERFRKEREGLLAKRAQIDEQLKLVDRHLKAADAYQAVLEGKDISAPRKTTTRRSSGKRGQKRQQLLDLIKENPDGLSRGEILDKLQAKGDKKAEQSISNALSNLKKQNLLDQREGRYLTH